MKWNAFLQGLDAHNRMIEIPDGPLCWPCGLTCKTWPKMDRLACLKSQAWFPVWFRVVHAIVEVSCGMSTTRIVGLTVAGAPQRQGDMAGGGNRGSKG